MGTAVADSGLIFDINSSRVLRRMIVLLSVFIVGACSYENFGDLEDYVEEVESRPAGRIEPIPTFKTYETFTYTAMDLRDPFRMFEQPDEALQQGQATIPSGPKPDINRNRETLEEFPLDTLRYVGQLDKANVRWGIITSPDDLVHRVTVGNHIGQNYGRITRISEEKIEIVELVPDGLGGWIEREAALSLGE